MKTISIAKDSLLSIFTIAFIEKLIQTIGGLEAGSFCIFERHFTDGSSDVHFDYPTDMDDLQATKILSMVEEEISLPINHRLRCVSK